PADRLGQPPAGQLRRGRQPQQPARILGRAGHRSLGLVDLHRDPGAALIEGRAHRGQRELASGPLEQHHAEPSLELRDLAADGRLRQPERATGRREAPGLDDLGEDDELVEVGLEIGHAGSCGSRRRGRTVASRVTAATKALEIAPEAAPMDGRQTKGGTRERRLIRSELAQGRPGKLSTQATSTSGKLSTYWILKSAQLSTNCHSPHSSANELTFLTLRSGKLDTALTRTSGKLSTTLTFPASLIPLKVQSSDTLPVPAGPGASLTEEDA